MDRDGKNMEDTNAADPVSDTLRVRKLEQVSRARKQRVTSRETQNAGRLILNILAGPILLRLLMLVSYSESLKWLSQPTILSGF